VRLTIWPSFFEENFKNWMLWFRKFIALSIYKMNLLEKIPSHAILFEAVEVAKKKKDTLELVNLSMEFTEMLNAKVSID